VQQLIDEYNAATKPDYFSFNNQVIKFCDELELELLLNMKNIIMYLCEYLPGIHSGFLSSLIIVEFYLFFMFTHDFNQNNYKTLCIKKIAS